MKKMKWKRCGAALLTLVMVLAMVPGVGYAVDEQPQEAEAAQVQAGTYHISVASDEGYGYAAIHTQDGEIVSMVDAAPGQKLYLDFTDIGMTPGTAFVKWVDDNGNLTDLSNVTSYHDCSFTMPEGDVRIHAELAQNCPKITVENGDIMVPYGENYEILNHPYLTAGREITLDFDDSLTPEGKTFKEWYVKSGDVVLSDPSGRQTCTFIVPDHDVEIGVRYEDARAISVEHGYAQCYLPNGDYVWNTSSAKPGTQMYLMVNPYTKPEGMAFSKWVVKKGNVALDQPYASNSCTFIMPDEDVEIAAEFVPGHALTVEGGDTCKTLPNSGYDWYIDMAAPGDLVWANYDPELAPEGMEFSRWVVKQGSMQLDTPEDEQCSFTMPNEDVVVSAEYRPVGGKAEAGWHNDNAGRWYNDETGHYMTGWQEIGGERYFFHNNGYMAKDEWIDGQYVDENGVATGETVATGWQHNSTGYWYNDNNGNYVTGWQHIGSYWYYFAADGYMQTGWQHLGRYWYYIAPEGNMLTGWQHIGSYWYYFAPAGNMQTGWQWIDGKCYYFHENGNMAADEWIGGSYVNGSGAWVEKPVATGWQSNSVGWWYNDTNGNYVTGWQHIGSYWYYFAADGYMQTDWQHIGSYWYYFAPGGNMLTGWQHIGSYWYYFAPEGNMLTGWQWIGGKCYYFYEAGNMAANTWIGGSYVDGSGAWVQ